MSTRRPDPTLKLPPLENWSSQELAYGFLLDRTLVTDYSGLVSPDFNARSGVRTRMGINHDIHILNLNPQDIQFSEPIATDVRITTGGGKYVESKGGVMKTCSIRGTTGLLPPISPHGHLTKPDAAGVGGIIDPFSLDGSGLLLATGFYEFHRLRRLFRQFMSERRQGMNVHMHYLDFKSDDFWLIEPKRFDLTRGVGRERFTYSYSIQFDCLEMTEVFLKLQKTPNGPGDFLGWTKNPRAFTTAASAPGKYGLLNGMPLGQALDPTARMAMSRMASLSTSGLQFTKLFFTGVLLQKMQAVIRAFTTVQRTYADLLTVGSVASDTMLSLYRQMLSALRGLDDVLLALDEQDPITVELNEWYLEYRLLVEGLIVYHQSRYGTTPGQAIAQADTAWTSQRAKQGFRDSLMQPSNNTASSPSVNPFVGAAGYQLTGDLQQAARTTVLRAEDILTNETIFDVARRLLGDVFRFVDLVILNNLSPPYIVSSSAERLPGTLAWGEQILIPAGTGSDSIVFAVPADLSIPAISGTVSDLSLTASTLVDVDSLIGEWRVNQWEGFTLEMLTGAAAGNKRVVSSNTATVMTLNRALDAIPAVGDKYRLSLELFTKRRPVTAQTRAFGHSLLLSFRRTEGLIADGAMDLVLGPGNNVQRVEGEENLKQAVTIVFQTPQNTVPLHPQFGVPSVIGRRMEPNSLALALFFLRQALLQDARIESVERPLISYSDGAMRIEVAIQPVRLQQTVLYRVSV